MSRARTSSNTGLPWRTCPRANEPVREARGRHRSFPPNGSRAGCGATHEERRRCRPLPRSPDRRRDDREAGPRTSRRFAISASSRAISAVQ
jgi:hypothetical protein